MASETIAQADKDCALAILEADIAAGGQTPFVKTAAHYIAAHRRAAVAELVEAIERALKCTVLVRDSQIIFDREDPREILRSALSRHQAGLGKGDDRG